MSIGPALPPGFKRTSDPEQSASGHPSKRRVGPSLADLVKDDAEIALDDEAPPPASGPSLAALVKDEAEINLDDDEDVGPRPPLPAAGATVHSKPSAASKPVAKRSFGPSLADLVPSGPEDEEAAPMPAVASAPQAAHVEAEAEEDDTFVGPLPPHLLAARGLKPRAIAKSKEEEAEAWRVAREGTKEDKSSKREDWMLTLPADRTSVFAGGNRSFDKKERDIAVDSSWTETPEERKRKQQEGAKGAPATVVSPTDALMQRKQESMAKLVNEYNAANRPKSLLDQHAAAKGAKGPSATSRPFDREKDMASSRLMSQKEKDTLVNDARGLNSRFAKSAYM